MKENGYSEIFYSKNLSLSLDDCEAVKLTFSVDMFAFWNFNRLNRSISFENR